MINSYSPCKIILQSTAFLGAINPYYAIINKEDNGDYYIEIESPQSDYKRVIEGALLLVPTPNGSNQYFRCENPVDTGYRCKSKARHIYYDAEKFLIHSCVVTNKTCTQAIALAVGACDETPPFTITSNISTDTKKTFTIENVNLREALEQITKQYDGHLVRDNWNIAINSSIGTNNAIDLRYGKNIKSFERVSDYSDVCTKLLPVGKDGYTFDNLYVSFENNPYPIEYKKIENFEQNINREDYDSEVQYRIALFNDLSIKARIYIATHQKPRTTYTIDAHVEQVVDIGDTVNVDYTINNVSFSTNVRKFRYDVVAEKYISVELGDAKKTITGFYRQVTK